MKTSLIRTAFLLLALVGSTAIAQQPTQNDNDQCAEPVFKGTEVDHKLRILAKPEPEYTKEDRRNYARGVIVLRAVFCGSGKVTDIKVTNGLSDGLNQRAVEAARKIRFIPAEKDGKKVSQVLNVTYRVNP